MSTAAITTRLYGNYISQPSRAVLWAAAMKKLPVELKKMNPMAGEAETPEFLAKFPSGYIPALEVVDNATGQPIVHLTEGPAILSYLAEAHGWKDLYPCSSSPSDVAQRAAIQQWMHWSHGNLRPIASTRTFMPMMLRKMREMGANTSLVDDAAAAAAGGGAASKASVVVLSAEEKADAKKIAAEKKKARDAVLWRDAMLTLTHGALKRQAFLASSESQGPTIADLSLYCEVDQVYFANNAAVHGGAADAMYDFGAWPEVAAWIKRMEQVPEHDSVRKTLFKFLGTRRQ